MMIEEFDGKHRMKMMKRKKKEEEEGRRRRRRRLMNKVKEEGKVRGREFSWLFFVCIKRRSR